MLEMLVGALIMMIGVFIGAAVVKAGEKPTKKETQVISRLGEPK